MLQLRRNLPERQRGVVMILTTIALFSIVAMVGMALDFSHIFTNRARLQNALDAAALAGAKVLDVTSDQGLATAAARRAFTTNIALSENSQIGAGGIDETNLIVEFSATVNPFTADANATRYMRVRMDQSLSYPTWFISVAGISTLNTSASAVAGPSPNLAQVCNVAPFMLCGDSTQPNFGYPTTPDNVVPLTLPANNQTTGMPGNFQLIRLGGAGANIVGDNLAGGFDACQAGAQLTTEPGLNAGQVRQGYNTRFGIYEGSFHNHEDIYPPDKVTTNSATYTYADYDARYDQQYYDHPNDGVADRRVLAVAVAQCNGLGGAVTLQQLGNVCVFLKKSLGQNELSQTGIKVEILPECATRGIPGPNPVTGPGPYTIQLYGDSDRWDT